MTAKLIRFKDLAPGIRHFVFELPGAGALDFQPGQFASLTAQIGGREITRAYSLAAAPRGDNQFEICLNLVPDGVFSPYLFALGVGAAAALPGTAWAPRNLGTSAAVQVSRGRNRARRPRNSPSPSSYKTKSSPNKSLNSGAPRHRPPFESPRKMPARFRKFPPVSPSSRICSRSVITPRLRLF